MKISKNTLDELIFLQRVYWNPNTPTSVTDNLFEKRKALSDSLQKQTEWEIYVNTFIDLTAVYVCCNATNETIYKAIELLGITIVDEM